MEAAVQITTTIHDGSDRQSGTIERFRLVVVRLNLFMTSGTTIKEALPGRHATVPVSTNQHVHRVWTKRHNAQRCATNQRQQTSAPSFGLPRFPGVKFVSAESTKWTHVESVRCQTQHNRPIFHASSFTCVIQRGRSSQSGAVSRAMPLRVHNLAVRDSIGGIFAPFRASTAVPRLNQRLTTHGDEAFGNEGPVQPDRCDEHLDTNTSAGPVERRNRLRSLVS